VSQKCCTLFVRLITSSNIGQFSNFFTVRIRRTFVKILLPKILPHLKCVDTLPLKCQCFKATVENKTSVTTYFKKLTTETMCLLSQLLSKVTVKSCSFYITCSKCSFCCWTTHSKMCCWFSKWKKFENWSIFDKVIKRPNVPIFGPPCRCI